MTIPCPCCGERHTFRRQCAAEVPPSTYRKEPTRCLRLAQPKKLYCPVHEKLGREGRLVPWRR